MPAAARGIAVRSLALVCPAGLVRAFGHILVLYCFVGDTHEAYAFIAKILSDPAVRPERCVSTTVESVPRKAT